MNETRVTTTPGQRVQHTITGADYLILGSATTERLRYTQLLYTRDNWRTRVASVFFRVALALVGRQTVWIRPWGEFNQTVETTAGGTPLPRFVKR
jgi:hypothetical protein